MKTLIGFLAIGFLASVFLLPVLVQPDKTLGDSGTFISLSLQPSHQEHSTWCWAATAHIVMYYHGESHAQCQIVDAVAHQPRSSTCCDSKRGEKWFNCTQTHWPEEAFNIFQFDYQPPFLLPRLTLPRLTWDQVTKELGEYRPYISTITYDSCDKSTHSVVVHGFRQDLLSLVDLHGAGVAKVSIDLKEVQVYDPQEDDSYWDWDRYSPFRTPDQSPSSTLCGDTYKIQKMRQVRPPKEFPEPKPFEAPGPIPFGKDREVMQAPGPEEAARKGLAVLSQLGPEEADKAYARSLGFASTEEAAQAELGSPLRLYRVPLNRLKAFHAGTNPQALLVDTQSVMYPLLIKGQVRSSLTVMASVTGTAWRPIRTGSEKLIRLLEQHRTPSSNDEILISEFGLRFLGDRTAARLMLIPIMDIPRLELKAGHPVPAQEIFAKLAPEANRRDQPARERGALKRSSPKQ